MMLKLAFNTTALRPPLTGLGYYTLNLAQEFIKHEHIDPEFFYAFHWKKELSLPSDTHNKQRLRDILKPHIPYSYELRRFWQSYKFKNHSRRHHFDIYHEPNYLLLPFDGPKVVTVHDLSWIRYPELHPIKRVRALNKYFEKSLNKATYILTDSEFIRQEVINTLSVDPIYIKAIPLGVDPLYRPQTADETQLPLHKYGLKYNSYLLAVGTLEPRKNLALVLQSYTKLPSIIRRHYPLVIAGMKGWHTDSIEQAIHPLIRNGEIRLLGYIPRIDLASITAGATTLIYPSIYEGFGLPPLEAMACAVPPVVSNVSSLPEVVSNTGLQVAPHDAEALTNAMLQLIEDTSYRNSLAKLALSRARQMTWKQCAKHTYHAYQQAIAIAQ